MSRSGSGARSEPEAWSYRDVSARGLRTRVAELGPERAPTVLLVHDLFASHASFDELAAQLATRFHVVAPDLPGFGESEKPAPTRFAYGIAAFTEAVADVVAALSLGRVALVGHGLGGAVALTLAADHAELVQRIVVIAPAAYPAPLSARTRVALAPLVGGLYFKQLLGRSSFRAMFRDEVYGPGEPLPARVDDYFASFNAPTAREGTYAVLRSLLDTRGVVARITRVTTPTLVIWGHDDQRYPVAHASRLVRDLHGAKLALLDGPHAVHEVSARAVAELVTTFFEGRR